MLARSLLARYSLCSPCQALPEEQAVASTKTRTRRSVEDRVAELQAQIAKIKAKAEQAKVKKDPALRHISGAVRSIDKATAATKDSATRSALAEARANLAACLALQ